MATYAKKTFKSILNKKKFIDSWFWDRYSINPYNGCVFGCLYCDARSGHYHMPEDFENNIVIKEDVGPMLDRRLSRARTLEPDVVGLGGVTDCYQPAESKYGNSRACLEVLAKHHYPVHLATKSTLVLRDADILNEIGVQTWCTVSFTITTLDDEISRLVDNRAPPPRRRLETLSALKRACPDIRTGVLVIPLIPVLSDDEPALDALVSASREAGADYVLFSAGMSLRDRQAHYFLSHLEASNSEAYHQYKELYGFSDAADYDGLNAPPASYATPKQQLMLRLCAHYDLPYRIPRFIPRDWRAINYRVAERLLNHAYLRQANGQYWQNFYWAGQNIQNLREPIDEVSARNELHSIRNVGGKIAEEVLQMLDQYRSQTDSRSTPGIG